MGSFTGLLVFFFTTCVLATPRVFDSRYNVTYNGNTAYGVDSFLNIPFAQDTSGANRFKSPQAFIPSNGTNFDNTVDGYIWPQPEETGFVYNSLAQNLSENCLNLKVVRPSFATVDSQLPVMVFIYGGDLFQGQIYERTQTGEGIIQQSVNNGLPVIYVAMNYRLNIFGFALSDALRSSNDLNVGLKDQRMALEWVQKNIRLFGGDPNRVTIFGQSSGSLSVTMQILAYGGSQTPPFHGAILESTALEPTATSKLTTNSFTSIAMMSGCAPEGTDPQSNTTLACLRNLSMEKLLNVTMTMMDKEYQTTDGDVFFPVVDGDFLPAKGSELVRTGRFSSMPLMAGFTRNEATILLLPQL